MGETKFSILADCTHCQKALETAPLPLASVTTQVLSPAWVPNNLLQEEDDASPCEQEQPQPDGGLLMQRAASWIFNGHAATLQPGQVGTALR